MEKMSLPHVVFLVVLCFTCCVMPAWATVGPGVNSFEIDGD